MRFFNRHGSRFIFLSGVALFLSACTVVEEGGPPPPWTDRPEACTFQYDPVCGARRGDRQTFGNACMARSEGYRVLYPGECRGGGDDGRPEVCTREYAPVCARQGPNFRTFPNRCEAEAADYRVIREGTC